MASVRQGRAAYEAALTTRRAEEVRAAQAQRAGADRFATVVVSATRDRFPIPQYFTGLPLYYEVGDLAGACAQFPRSGGPTRLSRIYYGDPLTQVFEFTSGSQRVLIPSARKCRSLPPTADWASEICDPKSEI